MKHSEILKEFEDANAILKGHFILSSGLHSDTYLQCARVLMEAKRAEKLCSELAKRVNDYLCKTKIDLVFAPAMGGVIVGYEMGRQLEKPSIFCERSEGNFIIRRGFEVPENANILMVEDVVTTGKSSIEAIKCAEKTGGKVIAEACLINRTGQDNPLPVPLISLANLDVKTFSEDQIPDELQGIKAIKPGSRWLKSS
jgi:orotate phosphoribosyltransferase